jgi:hypothetical protein
VRRTPPLVRHLGFRRPGIGSGETGQ